MSSVLPESDWIFNTLINVLKWIWAKPLVNYHGVGSFFELWVCTQSLSSVQLFRTPWAVAHQAPLSMAFSRQEYWSRFPFPSSRDLSHPGIEPASLMTPMLADKFLTNWTTGEVLHSLLCESESEVAQSCLTLCGPWTVAHQAPPSMGFSRQEYWSGLPFPSPGDLPNPGIEARSPTLQADALTSVPPGKPLKYKNTVSQKTSYRDTELLCSVPSKKKGMVGTRIYGILAKCPKSTRLNSD